jgi:hypothetical protein
MDDKQFQATMAGMTGLIAYLIFELDEEKAIDKKKFLNKLYVIARTARSRSPYSAAPIDHLISILENFSDEH